MSASPTVVSTVVEGPDASSLLLGDCIERMDALVVAGMAGSVDLVVADPPYFVGKADWDEPRSPHEVYEFHAEWLSLCRRLLKPGGSLWVSGAGGGIYTVGFALQRLSYHVMNSVAWVKPNPPPLQARRFLKPCHEQLIWVTTSPDVKPYFNYPLMKHMNGSRGAMGTVWTIAPPKAWEKRHGRHPTQKPEALVERLVLATSRPGELVLDPFVGSGTTAVAAVRHGRRVIGIDQVGSYLRIAHRRLMDERTNREPPPASFAAGDGCALTEAA